MWRHQFEELNMPNEFQILKDKTSDLEKKLQVIEKQFELHKNFLRDCKGQPIIQGYSGKRLDLNENLNVIELLNRINNIGITEAIVDFLGTVASQIAMLELTGERGDWCIRLDLSTVWMIIGDTPTELSSWQEWAYPAATGFLKLDQTTPQTVINGAPIFSAGLTSTVLNLSNTSDQLIFQSTGVKGIFTWTPVTTDKTITIPNLTGNLPLGAGTCSGTSTNDVTVANHTHAITGSLSLLGNGTAQYQYPVTGGTPFTPAYSAGFLNITAAKTLAVTGNTTVNAASIALETYTLTVPATGTCLIAGGVAGGQTWIGGTAVTDQAIIRGTSGNGTLTSPAITFQVGNNGGTNAITILNNAKFGIGTNNPLALTHIVSIDGAGGSSSGIELLRLSATYSGTAGSGAYINFTNNTDNSVLGRIRSITESASNVGLSFSTYNSGLSEKVRITSGGNVAIGNTDPGTYRLKVSGDTCITGLLNANYPITPTKTDEYTIADGDFTIRTNDYSLEEDKYINLPDASAFPGRIIIIHAVGGNLDYHFKLKPISGDYVEDIVGSDPLTINTWNCWFVNIMVQSDGSVVWNIINYEPYYFS